MRSSGVNWLSLPILTATGVNLLSGLFNTASYRRSEEEKIESALHWLDVMGLREFVNREAGNLAYGQRRPDARTFDRVVDLLDVGPLLPRGTAGLSGGEAARVAIGRALLSDPHLLVMDEPIASLDAPRRAEIMPYLERLRDQAGLPILYVSHAVDEVARTSISCPRPS